MVDKEGAGGYAFLMYNSDIFFENSGNIWNTSEVFQSCFYLDGFQVES